MTMTMTMRKKTQKLILLLHKNRTSKNYKFTSENF